MPKDYSCNRNITPFLLYFFLINLLAFILLPDGIANARRQIKEGPRKIKVGPLRISPSLIVEEKYTDNVFVASAGEESDFVTTFSPGLQLLLTPSRHNILFEYKGRFKKHAEFTGEDTNDHRIEALGELNFRGGLSLRIWDIFTTGHENRGDSSTGLVEKFETNTVAASALYEFGERYKVSGEFSNTNYDFEISPFRDRSENAGAVTLFYKFLPKTTALIEYDYLETDYDTVFLDSVSNSFLGGLEWELTEKTTGIVKAGYYFKDFDAAGVSSYKDFIFSGSLEFNFTGRTSLDLEAAKTVNESTLSGANYFVSKTISGRLTHDFTRKISSTLKTSYGVHDFDIPLTIGAQTGIREDKVFDIGGGVEYRIQEWLQLHLDYNHRDKNSSFDVFDYVENSVFISAKIVL